LALWLDAFEYFKYTGNLHTISEACNTDYTLIEYLLWREYKVPLHEFMPHFMIKIQAIYNNLGIKLASKLTVHVMSLKH
jgi:hypothetical protein